MEFNFKVKYHFQDYLVFPKSFPKSYSQFQNLTDSVCLKHG